MQRNIKRDLPSMNPLFGIQTPHHQPGKKEEIIKNLKNNKASGEDDIVSEDGNIQMNSLYTASIRFTRHMGDRDLTSS